MGHLPARLARILAYAVLACGAAVACLLLASSPAQADDSGSGLSLLPGATSEDEGAVETVGRLLGETTRSAADQTTDVVRDAANAVPVAEPVVQPLTDTTVGLVDRATDSVASDVEHVTVEVDHAVGGLLEPLRPPPSGPPPGGTPPTEQPPAEEPVAGPSGEPSTGGPAPSDEDRSVSGARDRDFRGDAPRRTDRDRGAAASRNADVAPALVVPAALAARPAIGAPADATPVGHEASALPDVGRGETPGCDACATGTSGSTGEPSPLHALVGRGAPASPALTAAGVDRDETEPAVTFSCPDASPG